MLTLAVTLYAEQTPDLIITINLKESSKCRQAQCGGKFGAITDSFSILFSLPSI